VGLSLACKHSSLVQQQHNNIYIRKSFIEKAQELHSSSLTSETNKLDCLSRTIFEGKYNVCEQGRDPLE
jgi:hypothetical protein